MPTLPQPGEPPIYPAIGEAITAMIMAYGIMLALYHQKRSGEGQEVDVSLFGSNIYFEHCYLQAYLGTYYRNKAPSHIGMSALLGSLSRKEQGNPLLNSYKTKDAWIYLGLHQSDLYWHNFCRGVGIEHLENDHRFATHSLRGKNNKELIAILDEILVSKTAIEWLKQWEGLELIVDVIHDFSEVEKDLQALESKFIIELQHASYGPIKMIGFPIMLVDTPPSVSTLAPTIGQHTHQVLTDVLSFTQDNVMELKKKGIIF
jgi:formyl-CoA transferase